jgi:hypothetical protein
MQPLSWGRLSLVRVKQDLVTTDRLTAKCD